MANLDLSKIKKEHLVLICAILAVVIVFAAYKNIFTPLLGKIKDVSVQKQQRQRDIQKAKVGPEVLKELEEELDEIKARIDYYRQGLLVKPDVPQILKELNQIAERLRIKFVSVNPLERKETILPGAGELLLQIPIRIKLQCGYHELGIFINKIENLPRFMKITELKINADSGNIWTHQAELVITSYSLIAK